MACRVCSRTGHNVSSCPDLEEKLSAKPSSLNLHCLGVYVVRSDVPGLEIGQGPGLHIARVRSGEYELNLHLGDLVIPKRRVGPEEHFPLRDMPDGTYGVIYKFDDPAHNADFIYVRWFSKDGKPIRYACSSQINEIDRLIEE